MIQITKVPNAEAGKKGDLRAIAENQISMAFENAYWELIVFIRITGKVVVLECK